MWHHHSFIVKSFSIPIHHYFSSSKIYATQYQQTADELFKTEPHLLHKNANYLHTYKFISMFISVVTGSQKVTLMTH